MFLVFVFVHRQESSRAAGDEEAADAIDLANLDPVRTGVVVIIIVVVVFIVH